MAEHGILPWYDRIWWAVLVYPVEQKNPPLTEGGAAQESDYPWRKGKARIFRLPRKRQALAIGRWGEPHPSEIDEYGRRVLRFRSIRWKDVVHDRKRED